MATDAPQQSNSSTQAADTAPLDAGDPRPGSLRAWLACIRPKTLGVAAAPVAVGLGVAAAAGHEFHFLVAVTTLALSLLMQIITNMENDAGYTKKKAERSTRKGLPRATANGWLTVAAVERAIKFCILLVVLDTIYLITVGGWVMVAVSLASVVAAYAYMGGPKPIAYTPFGELMVFIFFGLVAVGGTYYLQCGRLDVEALLAGAALGAIASGVLAVNNYRDLDHDREVGRRTLAVVMGTAGMQRVYQWLITAAFVFCAALAFTRLELIFMLAVFVWLPAGLALVRDLRKYSGNDLNGVMFRTVKLELRFALTMTLASIAGAVGYLLQWL